MIPSKRLRFYLASLDLPKAALTGLPHLLNSLRLLLAGLLGALSGSPAWEAPVHWLFAAVILGGLAWGLRRDLRKPPRWTGSWAGYALALPLELALLRYSGLPASTFGGIAWLVVYSAALIYLARGDRLRAVLAALPVAPVFIWSMALAGGSQALPGLAALAWAGLVLAAATALFDGFIWDRQAFWTVVLAILLGGLPVALAAGGAGSPAGALVSLLGYWIAAAVFSWPAWVSWFWEWVKAKVARGV